ncbi:DUF6869 domain-containing protein [Ramlibacter sp. MMS24-I3-19]|uniref:DUF6869 domain-containing protein n=1 Tax=Ramlibacter sp. MMS24-I3-19 TaxID=3416606 RepID=UPI003D0165DC
MLTTSDINEWTRASIHARQVSTGTWTSSAHRSAEETGTPEAEQSWRTLLRVLQTSADPEVHLALATGPLRRLIDEASGQFIDRIERAAWSNPGFCKLLALAWDCAPTDIWARIDAVRSVDVARRLAAGYGTPGR